MQRADNRPLHRTWSSPTFGTTPLNGTIFRRRNGHMIRHVVLLVLALLLAVGGYFLFAVVIAIYAGLLLHDEKMYYAQRLSAQLFGASGITSTSSGGDRCGSRRN
jgi:hypothetical protein